MVKYMCEICSKESSQKCHHDSHLKSKDHKNAVEIFRLKMVAKDLDEIMEEYPQFKSDRLSDEDFLIDGESEQDNIEAVKNAEKNLKYEIVKKIIKMKATVKSDEIAEVVPTNKYKPSNNIVWESQNEIDFKLTKTKENIMKLIKGVHQIFYDQGNTKGTMSDISKILALILLRPLFLDKKSHIWEKIEEVMDMESDETKNYIEYCTDINKLLMCEDPINDWKDMTNEMLVRVFPGYFNGKDSKLSCDSKCFVSVVTELNKIPGIFEWSPDKDYKENYKQSREKYSGDLTGDINEYFKNKYGGSGKELGQFFTPPKLINAILEGLNIISLIKDSNIKSVYDPCLGSAGFLVSTVKQIKDIRLVGSEKDSDTIKWAFQSLLLETGEIQSNIKCCDSILSLVSKGNILTNPPFKIRMTYKNEKNDFENENPNSSIKFEEIYPLKMNDPEALFIQHCVYHLGDNCVCSIILPYGKIFESAQGRFVKLRQWLVENVDITDLMLMPRGVFDYADPLTCNLVFVKRKSTGKIRFTELDKSCSKITHLFDITTEDIINSDKYCPYSFSHSDFMYHELPSKLPGDKYSLRELFTIVGSDISSGNYKNKLAAPYKLVTGAKYENWLNIEEYDYEGEFVFICLGGNGDAVPIKYHNGKFKFSNLMGKLVIKSNFIEKINVKYIYHLLLSNQRYIEIYMQKGSSNRTLHGNRINNLVVTIPSINKQNEYVDQINQREVEYENKKRELLKYKGETDNIICEMFPN